VVGLGILKSDNCMLALVGTFFTLDTASGTDLFAHASSLFNDSWVLIAVAAGIPLGFYVIRRVIGLIPKGR
jgi:hypothetical protein